jgi:transcriptional regulator with XRE-family HTH domain
MNSISDDGVTIGERLRALRLWRHMTLAEVAGLAGISAAYLSMAERGLRSVDRRSMISDLAAALRVSETELTGGPHLGSDPEQSAPHSAILALRVALETSSLADPADCQARPAADLAAELHAIKTLYYQRCDYVSVGERLPAVLDELHARGCASSSDADRRTARLLLVEACITAGFMAKDLGYLDLAHVAALRADEAARALGDPAALSKATFLRFHTAPREIKSWDRALAMATRAAGTLEPHAHDTEAVSVLGLLTLSAGLAAAVLQRGPDMEHWLSESAALAARVPDEMGCNWQSFCSTNVAIWRTSLAVERGEAGGKIAELARTVDERKITTRTRQADFLVDVGRGVARDPKAGADAVGWLHRAEATAPQRIRNYAPARETVAYLLTRATATAGGRELRGMAARMGVPH